MARGAQSQAWHWTAVAVALAVLSSACGAGSGGESAAGGGAGGSTGGSGGTAAAAGSSGAAGSGGSGASAGSGGTAGSGSASGVGGTGGSSGSASEICDNDQDDDADGFYDCDDSGCFADAGCIDADLAIYQMSGFVPCGKPVSFTNADSDATCQKYALGWSPQLGSKCQFASYSGTVSFYCPPKPQADAVGLRWVVHGHVPTETVNGKKLGWETLGGEYSFGSSGGSGMNPLHKFFDIHASDHDEDFVGYDKLGVKATTKETYTHWFAIWELTAAAKPQVSGGFVVSIDAAQLFATY
jgi:hypothetical protein